nr:DUF5698 domain-containing protein [Clostridium hydrogeniformans]
MVLLSYFAIFFAKVLEVSLATVRMVLITRGEKFWGSLIGFAEVVIWLYLIGSIISNVIEDPIKVVFYSLGFSLGNYVGAIIEERLALGLITLNIIASREQGDAIAAMLREKQVGVTTIDGEGKIEHKKMLIVHLKRKRKNEIVSLIEESSYNCVVSINDTKVVYGGYGLRK